MVRRILVMMGFCSVGEWNELYTNGRRSIKEGFYFGWKVLAGLKGDFDVIDCQELPYCPEVLDL